MQNVNTIIQIMERNMPSAEEYRKRAKEAREQADACRNEWERQGLLTIAEQCERLAAYKGLTGPSAASPHRPTITAVA
jgi:hypothetical protein